MNMVRQYFIVIFSIVVFAYGIGIGCASKPEKKVSALFDSDLPEETPEETKKLEAQKITEIIAKATPPPPVEKLIEIPKFKDEPVVVFVPTPIPTLATDENLKEPKVVASNEKSKKSNLVELKNHEEQYIVYEAKGGEALTFVGLSMTGSRANTEKIRTDNLQYKSIKSILKKGDKVKIRLSMFQPNPYLTPTNIIKKYSHIIAPMWESWRLKKGLFKDTTLVQKKETLQSISKRLYKTTRRWTELYAFNYKKIEKIEKLKKGTPIDFYRLKTNSRHKNKRK